MDGLKAKHAALLVHSYAAETLFRKQNKELAEVKRENERLSKDLEEAQLLKKASINLAKFIEPDGKPVDGFYFRTLAVNFKTITEIMEY